MTDQVQRDDDGHPVVPVIRWANVGQVPATSDAAVLEAWAQEAIPKLAAVFRDMATALQPLAEAMARANVQHHDSRHLPQHTGRLRSSVPPFWAVQPNKTRRRS